MQEVLQTMKQKIITLDKAKPGIYEIIKICLGCKKYKFIEVLNEPKYVFKDPQIIRPENLGMIPLTKFILYKTGHDVLSKKNFHPCGGRFAKSAIIKKVIK